MHIKDLRCAVVGHGSWATAIAKVLSGKTEPVRWYVRNPEVIESLQNDGRNCRYLSDVEFDKNHIRPSSDINEVVANSDIVFLVTPAAYLKSYLFHLDVSLKDKIVVSAIKGIIPGEYQTVTEYMHDHYDLSYDQLCFISGPTHAEEVSHNRLTHITIACQKEENALIVGRQMENSFLVMNYSTKVNVMELSAILKNIYAVASGFAFGLGYGDNFMAVLVSNSAKEMFNFIGERCELCDVGSMSASILGDLLVSCYSSHSRNRQLGVLIGRGNTVRTALNEMTMVAEGYFAADYIRYITMQQIDQMPIATMVYQVLYKETPVRKAMKELENKLQ